MHTIKFLLLLAGLIPLVMTTANSATLCTADEVILFSCNTKTRGRIISLCGSIKPNGPTSYIQYRFGTPKRIELVYPTDKKPPGTLFTTRIDSYAGASYDAIVNFTIKEYSYVIYSGHYVGGSLDDINNDSQGTFGLRAGVAVSRSEKDHYDIPCKKDELEDNPSELSYKVESYLAESVIAPITP
jgi:hypothetical protein